MNSSGGSRQYRLLAYGFEKTGLAAPTEPIISRNYTVTFEPFSSSSRFNEYDGVLIFQSIFESFERYKGYAGMVTSCTFDTKELDKRQKELQLLLNQGGLACFCLNKPIIDNTSSGRSAHTDLSKLCLNRDSLYRHNFGVSVKSIRVVRDEFNKFLGLYGAAWSYFESLNRYLDMKIIAKSGNRIVSMILDNQLFFVPALIPERDRIAEFVRLLCDALTATVTKLQVELPNWLNEYKFDNEESLLERREERFKEIADLDSELSQYERYKRILVSSSDSLVESVTEVFETGFGFNVDSHDEYREDLKLLDEDGKPIVFAEIKGTNRGVKGEYTNQADTHRERAGLPRSFPTILIINTNIKNARSIDEKDDQVASEQVRHARANNVLIVRTYDLLELLRLHLAGKLPQNEMLKLLKSNSGWLRVKSGEVKILR